MDDKERFMQVCKMAELGILSASIAHEMRQPLFAIKSFAQLMMADSKYRGDTRLEEILGSVASLEHLVGRVGEVSRMPSEAAKELDINSPLLGALSMMQFKLQRASITVHEGLGNELPAVKGNYHSLQQVFLNLLQNSLDATEGIHDRRLWISSQKDGKGHVQVLIGDNGSGIDLEDPSQLFEYFYTTKPAGKGTGLGLAISSEIARTHGGSLELVQDSDMHHLNMHPPLPVTLFRLRIPTSLAQVSAA